MSAPASDAPRTPRRCERVVELRTAPDAARPVLDARTGEEIEVAGGVRFRLVAPYPRGGSSPTGGGNRLWRARVTGTDCAGGPSRRARAPDRLRLPRRAIPARRLPDGLRPASRAAPRCPARQAVHARAGHPPDRRRASASRRSPCTPDCRRRMPASHRRPSGSRSPAATARLVQRGARRAAGESSPSAPRSCARSRRRPTPAVSSIRGAAGPSSSSPPTGRSGPSTGLITGWHDPDASHLLLVEAVAGARARADAPTTPPSRRAISGTSSATRASCCRDSPSPGTAPPRALLYLQGFT